MTLLTSVLIVDDEPAVRDIISRWATALGLSARTAANADEAIAMLRTKRCDLAVIDVRMPGRDGLWLAGELRRDHPDTAVVLATAHTSLLDGEHSGPPIADLLIKPFARERFAIAVERGRHWRKDALDEQSWQGRLAIELRDRIESICVEVGRQAEAGAHETSVLSAMALARTPGTMEHGERVACHAAAVARYLGLNDAAVAQLETVARFHDIGKLAIPDSLLNKPSLLTPSEQMIARRHVDAGAEILASTRTLHDAAVPVLATHEWFAGGGYPLGLAGDAIPLPARIVAVLDSYDAMTHSRHNRGRLDSSETVSELLRCAGTQFDPAVVDALLVVLGTH